MGRWLKPEVYPLMAAMGFVVSMCTFQLTRNMVLNPDVRFVLLTIIAIGSHRRINKTNRTTAILDNTEEGHRYSQHGLRRFLSHRPPEIMPALNSFFSNSNKN